MNRRPLTTGLLAASLAALALFTAACGNPELAASGPDAPADDTDTSAADAGWLTENEKDEQAGRHDNVFWLAATFLPEGVDEPVAASELETRYLAFTPPDGQADVVPAAEAFAQLHGATPQGLSNPLGGLEIQLFGAVVETAGDRSVLTVDFGEGIAASRSMSATESRLAFNQFVGMLALHFPDADSAQVTVEGQADPELFGGIDTTAPFTLRP